MINVFRNVLGRRIDLRKGIEIVEVLVVEICEHLFEYLLQLAKVHDNACGVKLRRLHSDLHAIVVAVQPLAVTLVAPEAVRSAETFHDLCCEHGEYIVQHMRICNTGNELVTPGDLVYALNHSGKKEATHKSMPTIDFSDTYILRQLAGDNCSHLKILEESIGVKCALKGNTIDLSGESLDVELAEHTLKDLYKLIKGGFPIYPDDVWYAVRMISKDHNVDLEDVFKDNIYISSTKKVIFPKSLQQKRYIDAMRFKDILFGIGPAGTGKTYLALAMGVHYLLKKKVERIVLTRPAVEAGERLGFLPGDLQEKVNPYLRPLYDALYDMLERDHVLRLIARDHIEVAPLAFMRGRTLNDAFIILDEAQNTTSEQMKMFLTRLGFNSKAVITGDVTQIDLPQGTISGLVEASQILKDIDELGFVYFSEDDVVRHKIVAKIIRAYDKSGR